ncbi:hypothetical protein [Rhizorhapis sp. SPR117]|uniref:hypothetical protein n=1 Tax=Rhizorhapis sp. SPR117 TaxID=2912611 RepID=UPI001F2FEEBD|nr:hypothetical protein [Rhizorhapis sp. SPR117]
MTAAGCLDHILGNDGQHLMRSVSQPSWEAIVKAPIWRATTARRSKDAGKAAVSAKETARCTIRVRVEHLERPGGGNISLKRGAKTTNGTCPNSE